MNIGGLMSEKILVELRISTVRTAEPAVTRVAPTVERDFLNLNARPSNAGVANALAKVGLMTMDKASTHQAASDAGNRALDTIINRTNSPVARSVRRTAGAMPTWQDRATVLRKGLENASLLEGNLSNRGTVDAIAKLGIAAMDASSTHEGAAAAGSYALDDIIERTNSPVGRTLRETANAMATYRDRATVLRTGLEASHKLEGNFSREGNARAMAEAGRDAIRISSSHQAAATAGSKALDGIITQTDSPVARTLRETAWEMRTFQDRSSVLNEGLAHPQLLDGTLGREGNARAMARVGVMAIDRSSSHEASAKAGFRALDSIINQTDDPVARAIGDGARAMRTWQDQAAVLRQGLQDLS